MRGYLGQRVEHEKAVSYMGMGDDKLTGVEHQVIIEQYVYVDEAVGIHTAHTLTGAPQLTLNILCAAKHFVGREGGTHTEGGIQESMF